MEWRYNVSICPFKCFISETIQPIPIKFWLEIDYKLSGEFMPALILQGWKHLKKNILNFLVS
jgi:hypothetical protein